MGRALGSVVAPPALWLIVVVNVSAVVAAALVHRIAVLEGLDERTARHAATLMALVPPAFVLAWGYAEGLFLMLIAGTLGVTPRPVVVSRRDGSAWLR